MNIAFGSCALLMDMGTGKSLTTVMIAGRQYLDGYIKRLLIVAPASVCAVWPAEFEKWGDFPAQIELILGTRDKRLAALKRLMCPAAPNAQDPLRVAVINYESTWRLEEELAEFAADMIVCDESQRIKGHTTAQSKAMHRLGDTARYKLILTGTPVQNDTRDVWSQYRFLAPSIFGTRYRPFEQRYAIMGGVGNHQYFGPMNLDEMTRKAHSVAFRVTKEECLDLPEQMFEDRVVALDSRSEGLYKRMKEDSYTELTDGGEVTAENVLTRLLRLQQITGGYISDDEGKTTQVNTAKLDALRDIIESYCIDDGRKLVVFARFRAEIDGIMKMVDELFEGTGLERVAIWGDIESSKRGALVEQFQTDPNTRVFIGQIDACAEGITLTAANTTVYYSVNWNLAKYQQSLARIHRIGQRNACTYIHLIVPKTIDEKIMQALHKKEDLAKSVVDNWRIYFE